VPGRVPRRIQQLDTVENLVPARDQLQAILVGAERALGRDDEILRRLGRHGHAREIRRRGHPEIVLLFRDEELRLRKHRALLRVQQAAEVVAMRMGEQDAGDLLRLDPRRFQPATQMTGCGAQLGAAAGVDQNQLRPHPHQQHVERDLHAVLRQQGRLERRRHRPLRLVDTEGRLVHRGRHAAVGKADRLEIADPEAVIAGLRPRQTGRGRPGRRRLRRRSGRFGGAHHVAGGHEGSPGDPE